MESKKNYLTPETSKGISFISDQICGATISGGNGGGPGIAESKAESGEIEEAIIQMIEDEQREGKGRYGNLW